MRTFIPSISGLLALVITGVLTDRPAHAVTLAGGDAIKVDFSTAGDGDGGSVSDWNSVGDSTSLAAGTVKRHGGGLLDGVSISFNNMINGRFNNDGASANWGGTNTDPYYIRAADDIYFHGGADDLEVVFGGLDPSLSYTVRLYSLINGQSTTDTFVVSDGAGFQSVTNTRSVRWNAGTLEDGGTVFSDLQLNGSNQLTVRVQDVGSVYYPLNAIVVQAASAVPEPSAALLFGAGLLGLGWRRKAAQA